MESCILRRGKMMKIRGKRGWIRIVEAFIAVTLIMVVMLSIYSSKPAKNNGEEIGKIMDATLDEIANNNQLRQDVLDNRTENINFFVSERIPKIMNYEIRICEVEDICNLPAYIPEVYAKERIISSTLKEYNVTKLKLFVWEK